MSQPHLTGNQILELIINGLFRNLILEGRRHKTTIFIGNLEATTTLSSSKNRKGIIV
jgi:hypothetical protein